MKQSAEFGSDIIVDLMKTYEIEYAALNLGATFRGLHDLIVNYGSNRMPQIILCNHEEIAAHISQVMTDPPVDFVGLALGRAVRYVTREKKPALVDIVTRAR